MHYHQILEIGSMADKKAQSEIYKYCFQENIHLFQSLLVMQILVGNYILRLFLQIQLCLAAQKYFVFQI